MEGSVFADVPHVVVCADSQLANRVVVIEELIRVQRDEVVKNVQVVDDADQVPFLRGIHWSRAYLRTINDGNAVDVTIEHQLQDLEQRVVRNAVGEALRVGIDQIYG